MTAIESIYEMKSAVLDLQRYLLFKDEVVSKKAQIRYLKLVYRFFRENRNYVKPEQRWYCLHDPDCFLGLMESAVEHYYLETAE